MPDRPSPAPGPAALGAGVQRRELLRLAALGSLAGCAAPSTVSDRPTTAAEAVDEAARLFGHLTDQRGGHEPIGDAERAERRRRLGRLLAAAQVDAFLCEGGPTMSYLAGVSWGRSERLFALAVLADGSHFWVCPAFEAEKARLKIAPAGGELVTWDEDEYAWAPLASALRARRAERVALDPSARWFIAGRLAAEPGAPAVVDAQPLVVELRGRKDAHELALLRRANELTQQAIVAVHEVLRPGMRADEIARLMNAAQRRLGLERTWCLALIGPAAAYPHGDDHSRTLESGDFLLVDTGGSFHDYQSDNTRTWVVHGPVGVEERRAWQAVRDAQARAFEAIRPGVPAREVDAAARRSIVDSGYPGGFEVFTHRLGHGIGLEGHEDPYFDGGSEVVLQPGMTLSDEPGIYLYGRFGVRIEDIVQVTEDGADHFGSWQRGPQSPA